MFSVHALIKSEITYNYNYDNFGDIFKQGYSNSFNIYKYKDIDSIFETKYEGSNVGGAFLVNGQDATYTDNFDAYIVDFTATFYCSNSKNLYIYVRYNGAEPKQFDNILICDKTSWTYNYTWTPPLRFSFSKVSIYLSYRLYSWTYK